ncbi:MAG: hypothetical protein PHE88_11665 [Elusimicrobia bacterium]|nr:hypothetical protein [Elusimicrobiota bacterium]
MSDNDPVVEVTEAAPVEESKEPAPAPDETPKSEDEQAKAEVEEERKLTQKEVDEAIQKRLARESRKLERQIRAEIENKYLKEQLESQQQRREPEQSSGEPKPEHFKTYEEYIDKLTDWKVDQKLAQAQQKTAQQRDAEAQQEYEATAGEKLRKGIDKFDDYEEVVESIPAQYITVPMTQAIAESDAAAAIAYYLGNNHKEAAEIARMTPVQQVKAIDRLEAKLKAPPQVSKAPPPADITGKGRAKSEPDLSKMSVSEYAEYRAKNGARWAR